MAWLAFFSAPALDEALAELERKYNSPLARAVRYVAGVVFKYYGAAARRVEVAA